MRKEQEKQGIRDLKNEDEMIGGLEPEEDRVFTRGNSRKDKDLMGGHNGNLAGHDEEDLEDDEEGSDDDEGSGEEIEDEDDDSDF